MARKRGHTKEYVEAMKDAEPEMFTPHPVFPDLAGGITDEWHAWHKRKLAWEDKKYGQHASWGED